MATAQNIQSLDLMREKLSAFVEDMEEHKQNIHEYSLDQSIFQYFTVFTCCWTADESFPRKDEELKFLLRRSQDGYQDETDILGKNFLAVMKAVRKMIRTITQHTQQAQDQSLESGATYWTELEDKPGNVDLKGLRAVLPGLWTETHKEDGKHEIADEQVCLCVHTAVLFH